ncbi:ATP-dependent DNA helicase RecG [Candidatus Woesebacteria bacterium CG22_combo_CG10-13_8_21_14_all_39_10]|uniref:Probable DNA 3'-5' helicase RecG n=1 Tax=Candidatus Woesebacteria bacterium CG22_combo_CG10-13_8_21_14_all_39_10 TaxID=1975059 RepID=A0A2H0BJ99_9BACT|nr:MAG: ATP-dependent DNA helicase RecG [Candidatus Woesebacteria bacterium CG22_combo_CG10-13_8_21_14_all_39_10]
MDLNSPVGVLPMVGPIYQKRLEKIGIKTFKDLIYHIPARYLDFREKSPISRLSIGESITIKGKVDSIKNLYTRSGKKIQLAQVSDKSGSVDVIWFNQPFLIKTIKEGETYSFSGKVDWFGRKKAMISPLINTFGIVPIYPETYGISSKWLRGKIKTAYQLIGGEITEYLPQTYGFLDLPSAIKEIHFPNDPDRAKKARERLAFDELLALQITNLKRKSAWQKNHPVYNLEINRKEINQFIDNLPFKLTVSQNKVIDEIIEDLQKPYPMNRLLEGDVGSGKTVVAAAAAFIAFLNGCQSVIMTPTQILAQQHFDTLNNLLQPFKVRISLITSAITEKDLGRCDIFVGTHSLIHQKINIDKVALVVIDEQHKFGVEQREHLVKKIGKKNISPHVLTMTATPIPRTVALTFYGDLDLSTLNETPEGRQKITTWVVPKEKRDNAYKWIDKNIQKIGSQVFIVCPLIEESESETLKDIRSVTKEYQSLKKIFKGRKLGLLHGKLKMEEKNKVVDDFRSRKLDILVATPVVEVGIDIPNATIMVIEAADRFGLAQLHQLRGRVGRSDIKSYCLLFYQNEGEKSKARLSAMEKGISGFELAELDLKLRGPGEIFGLRQSGIPELKIASWTDIDLIKKAKEAAEEISK